MNYAEIIDKSVEQLQEKAKKQKKALYEKRFRFLILLKSGKAQTQKDAGEMVGWKLRYSQKIWQIYQEQGLVGLGEKSQAGSFGNLSSQEIARLLRYMNEFGFDSLEAAGKHIEQSFGVSYTIGGVSWLFKRLKVKLKTTRPSNTDKDQERADTYKKTSHRSEQVTLMKMSSLRMK
ncbi:MAG: winged helix-turn-helix domain-containing protein [Acidobacteriota bacterium]